MDVTHHIVDLVRTVDEARTRTTYRRPLVGFTDAGSQMFSKIKMSTIHQDPAASSACAANARPDPALFACLGVMCGTSPWRIRTIGEQI